MNIDGHPVVTKVTVDHNVALISYPSEQWIKDHVQTSQYLLQIRKFQNKKCCQPIPYTCNMQVVLSQPGFLPGPVVITRGENGLSVGDPIWHRRGKAGGSKWHAMETHPERSYWIKYKVSPSSVLFLCFYSNHRVTQLDLGFARAWLGCDNM